MPPEAGPNLLWRHFADQQDSEGNEENRYPVPDSNKTKINDPKEHNNTNKTLSKKKFCK
jgi:hypothetical protein